MTSNAYRVKTMNWNTGKGHYELEQLYIAYAKKSYSTCMVTYSKFHNTEPGTMFGCGIRHIMNQYDSYRNGGLVVSFGKNVEVRPPNNQFGEKGVTLDFEGIALVVKDIYRPEYRDIKNGAFGENHVMRVPVNANRTYEYMIAGAWSEGKVNRTADEFKKYMVTAALEFNNPPAIKGFSFEVKPESLKVPKSEKK